ncbi:MAG TPA: OmpA family protein [Spirochaetota bacterium]|nr:OmpA family protein [Spirochaetota bacterium]HNT12906.1 OmpA family protein [Spirochaetota bacterium]HPI23124.1 OmpA family protein [Spirochaetota bacterium]HPU89978.1 OmpA family protein [Spirochaetota bacterium]
MKKFSLVLFILVIAVSFAAISCSGQKKSGAASSGNMVVDALNASLAKVPIEGFQSGKAASKQEWDAMITKAIPVVKEVLPKVPDGYSLQTTGHTDAQGGVNSAGNLNLSTARAKQVYDAIKKQGVNDKKFTYKGVAGNIISSKCGANDNCQRRVTFMVVPAK